MIYLAVNVEQNICKIGYSNNVSKRIIGLNNTNPIKLDLFLEREGDIKLEKYLHAYFRKYRIANEWFKLSGISEKEVDIAIEKFNSGDTLKSMRFTETIVLRIEPSQKELFEKNCISIGRSSQVIRYLIGKFNTDEKLKNSVRIGIKLNKRK